MSRSLDAAALIRLHSAPGLGARTLHHLLVWARGAAIELPDLFALDLQALIQQAGLKPELARAVLATSLDDADAALEQLQAMHVRLVTLGEDDYPAQLVTLLGESMPPILYVQGDVSLLSAPGIAFSGSRHTSDPGIGAARELAAQAAARGLSVISGHAPGTDLAAHASAIDAGGITILVLPEGVLRFRLNADLRTRFEQSPDRFGVVSEFPPGVPWSTANAMIRNNTILGLARALVVVEAGETGGTLAAGQKALKLGLPCYVLEMPNLPLTAGGNRVLLDQGAHAIRPDPNGALSLPELAQDAPAAPPDDASDGQLRLF